MWYIFWRIACFVGVNINMTKKFMCTCMCVFICICICICVAICICACLVSSHIFCNKWGSVCSTVPLKFRWQRCHVCTLFYYHHQIGSIDLRHCCHIILWICVWGGYNTTICRSRCIYTWKVGTLYYLGKLSSISWPYGRMFYEI